MTRVRLHLPAQAARLGTFRFRLAGIYAALFLVAGAALLALTYGLVAHSLPPSTRSPTTVQQAKASFACKQTTISPKPATPPPGVCKHAYLAGAKEGAQSQRDRTLHDLLVYSLLGLGAITLASGGLGWFVAGRVLRPLRIITGAARRASDEHLGERLDFRGPRDELRELADTFDDMLDRLDAAFALQRRFVADASHELRTPLTVMRTAVDVTMAKPARTPEQLEAMAVKIHKAVDQAESMVQALLTLARAEHAPRQLEQVDLADVAQDALDDVITGEGEAGVRVKSDLSPACATGDRRLLEVLVGNLVENAFRHNVDDGWVDVFTGVADDAPFVTVANSGPVVPDELVHEMFEPFRRMEARTNAHDGVGLGLAIVKSIAQAHEARVEPQSRLGGGLTISVVFPTAGEGSGHPTS